MKMGDYTLEDLAEPFEDSVGEEKAKEIVLDAIHELGLDEDELEKEEAEKIYKDISDKDSLAPYVKIAANNKLVHI